MIFQSPGFLWALFALAIPIFIHLFRWRKSLRVSYSHVRFLSEIQHDVSRHKRLKEILTLLARFLALIMTILAFAQPMWLRGKNVSPAPKQVALYVDNSHSMSAAMNEQWRALDAAKALAKEIVNSFSIDTRFKLITNDFLPSSYHYKTQMEVAAQIDKLRFSNLARTWEDVLGRHSSEEGPLFFISDFQQSTIGNIAPPDSARRLKLIYVASPPAQNVSVDTAFVNEGYLLPGQRNTLRLGLKNHGDKPIEKLLVKLSINDVHSASTVVNIAAKGSEQVSFDMMSPSLKNIRLAIDLEDYPVSFDNTFYAALNPSVRLRIVEISDKEQNSPLKKVYGNQDIFSFANFAESRVNYADLRDADVIILNGLTRLNESLYSYLITYVKEGKRLCIIPPTNGLLAPYKSLLNQTVKETAQEKLNLEKPDKQPFFDMVFENHQEDVEMPWAISLWRFPDDRHGIVKYGNGQSFISRHENTFLFSSAIEKTFTNLAQHAIFVPIMYRLASFQQQKENEIFSRIGRGRIVLKTDSAKTNKPVHLIGNRQDIVPEQTRHGRQIVISLSNQEIVPGFYYAVREDTLTLLALNTNRAESELTRISIEDLHGKVGDHVEILPITNIDTRALRNDIRAQYAGVPLSKYALLLSLLFLLVEICIIRFFKP